MDRARQWASETSLTKKAASQASSAISLDDLCGDAYVGAIITQANEHLRLVGYTEHGHRHAGLVANICLLYTSPSPRDGLLSRMPSSA